MSFKLKLIELDSNVICCLEKVRTLIDFVWTYHYLAIVQSYIYTKAYNSIGEVSIDGDVYT